MSQRAIKSAERTLGVFEIFSKMQRPLTVGDVCRALHIPQPSASMLLRNLSQLGYLSHDPHKRTYAPTIRLVLLGSWLQRSQTDLAVLTPRLSDIQAQIGETAYIGMQNGSVLQYVLVQEGDRPERLHIQSGQTRPLACSAAGRVLLALKNDDDIRGWVRRANAETQEERHRVRENEIMQVVADIRRDGYAETDGTVTQGHGAIAIAIASSKGGPPLAVGFGGHSVHIAERRELIISALKDLRANLRFATSDLVEHPLRQVA